MWGKLGILLGICALALAVVVWDTTRIPASMAPDEDMRSPVNIFARGGGSGAALVSEASTVPDVALRLLDGQMVNLHDYAGRVMLLNFWASWCAPCVVEFPQMLALAREHGDDVVFIAVSVDAKADNIRQFLKGHDLSDNVIIAHDPDQRVAQDVFQTVQYPETYIIKRDLTIADKVIGMTDWSRYPIGPLMSGPVR